MATQYTDAFKQETLGYIQDNPHQTRKQSADEWGIAHGTLKGWCAVFKDHGVLTQPLSATPTNKELEQQLKQLKREWAQAHQALDPLISRIYLEANGFARYRMIRGDWMESGISS